MKAFCKKHAILLVLALDIAVIGVLWYLVPWMKHPLDGLAIAVILLGVITVIATRKNKLASSIALVAVSIGLSVFALEMGEKLFSLTGVVGRLVRPAPGVHVPGKYDWNNMDPATYIAARDRALRDGVDPDEIFFEMGGDVFAREGIEKRRVRQDRHGKALEILESESAESPWLRDLPLGSELRANNVFRQFCRDDETGTMMYDGVCHTGPYGYRVTRGREDADEAYVFMGCSFTFGSYLNDDQTLPHYFSELRGFDAHVVNLAIGGNGPHHSLRDLELNYRLGRTPIKPEQVKAVVYSYMDQHACRVIAPFPEQSPRYVLENGKPVYAGSFADTEDLGRLRILLSRSRLYTAIRDGLAGGQAHDYELTYAILAEMHRICRERYGIPLTVVYWDDTPEARRRFNEMGVRLVMVSDAFGSKDWREMNIKYRIFDMHPSPNANKLLARAVSDALVAVE